MISLTRLGVQIRRDYVNFFLGQTHRIAEYYSEYLLTADQWPVEEKLKEIMSTFSSTAYRMNVFLYVSSSIQGVTREEVQDHILLLFKDAHIRMIVSGNVYKDVSFIHCF
jgi:insulysin